MAANGVSTNGIATNGHADVSFEKFYNTIDGKLTDTKQHRQGINPATDKPSYDVPVSTEEDLDNAVKAAKKAWTTWKKTTIADRQERISKFAEAFRAQADNFVKLLTLEQGKALPAAMFEVQGAGMSPLGLMSLALEDEVLEDSDARKVVQRYVPLGVVGAIVPWNFPVALAIGKITSALVTGNCVILKPSPFTPYCGLKMVEIARNYFPPGVIQALSGDDNLGPWITSHPSIDKVSFTGSSFTGKKVMASCAKTLKRVTLELGGNDPAIVCADVDIAKVAPQVAQFAFFNSGQVCIALKRIFVHESIFEEFRDAMVEAVKSGVKMGNGTDEGVTHGPVQNKMQYEKVKQFYDAIPKEKWTVALGGNVDSSKPGYFLEPTIIDRPADDSKIVVEEPFGPIVPLLSWKTEEEVVARANDTRMGLAASVWATDLDMGQRIANQIEAGTVWVNQHMAIDHKLPFGGAKESGIGVEYGREGLKAYCQLQIVNMKKA